MNPPVQARARTSEGLWRAIALFVIGLVVVLLLVHYFTIDLSSALLLGLIVTVIVLFLFRKQRAWSASDAVNHCYKEWLRFHKTPLDKTPGRVEVQPNVGKYWIVDFTWDAIAFSVDPVAHNIVGFRVKNADTIVDQHERSQILRSAASQSIADQAKRESLEKLGFDTADFEPENTEDE